MTITLENGTKNILKSGSNAAGLQKNGDEDVGTLTIKGTGALDATGGKGAAGIGGSWSSKRIVINSGTIEATGGMNAAGIGGAANSSGEVTITGGTVNATAVSYTHLFCIYGYGHRQNGGNSRQACDPDY